MSSAREESQVLVKCTSAVYELPSRHPVSESRTWRVALSPSRRPMARGTDSMRVNDDPDVCCGRMYAVGVVALGTMHAHCVTKGLPCGCEALRVRTKRAALCARTCRRFTLQQAAWSSGPFSSQVHGRP